MTKQIVLYDTTLRDGTQGEQVNLSAEDKLRIAHKLDELGIQYVEGGWPGFLEFGLTGHLKETCVFWIGARPSSLHVLDPEFIQLVGDPELILG